MGDVRVIYYITIALISAVLVCGCVQFKTNTSTGPETITKETRSVAPFTSIDFALPGTLYVTQNNTQSVVVEAKDSIVPSIRTEVTNGVLKIANKSACVHYDTTHCLCIRHWY